MTPEQFDRLGPTSFEVWAGKAAKVGDYERAARLYRSAAARSLGHSRARGYNFAACKAYQAAGHAINNWDSDQIPFASFEDAGR